RPARRGRAAAGAAGQTGDFLPPQTSPPRQPPPRPAGAHPGHPGGRRRPPPGTPPRPGRDLSRFTGAVPPAPPRRPPFELHVSTGPSPQTHLGGPAAAAPVLLLQFAVCRRAGVTAAGPRPGE